MAGNIAITGSLMGPMAGGAAGENYLLGKFEYAVDAGAPLSSPYSESGKAGSLVLTQTDGQYSISSGVMNIPIQSSANWGDQGFVATDALARGIGRALFATITISTGGGCCILWRNNQSLGNTINAYNEAGFYLTATAWYTVSPNVRVALDSFSTGTYQLAVILRSIGAYYLIKGGAFTEWTLIWFDTISNAASLYASLSNYTLIGTLDDMFVADMAGAWTSDWGIATNRLAVPSSGDTTTSEADGISSIIWTPGAGETLDFQVRGVDDNNCWIIRGDQAASKIYLYEKDTGVETERGATGGKAQTWTVSTAYKIRILHYGNTIKVFVDDTLQQNYASASFNNTATRIKASGFTTAADLVCLPRVMSGGALTALSGPF